VAHFCESFCVECIIMAPPTPMLARAAINMPTDPENAA
jgi:hypothetical protein